MAQGMKRKEIRQALKEMPIEQVLMVGKSELTPKQREFARQVALGNTGAEAYRRAYNTNTTPKRQGDQASRMKANPRIAAEIEAYEMALEAQKYRSSESLRALVIQSLVSVLIDPDAKQSTKVTAAKVLGTVTEVAAFTERKEITTITGSDAIKSQIMDQLKTLMLGSGAGQDVTDVDAVDLLAELSADPGHDAPGADALAGHDASDQGADAMHNPDDDADADALQPGAAADADPGDPTLPPPPALAEPESHGPTNTIPPKQSPQNMEPTPMSVKTHTPGGV